MAKPANPSDDRPSIAVLPFAELGGGESRGGLGDAFAHDVIVELSRRRLLKVIARGSTFQFHAQPANLDNIGRVLGVRYVLTGSSHADGGRVRVTTELAECDTGQVLWADGFDRPYSEIFELRQAVSQRIAASVSYEIERAEVVRARDLDAADLGAWASYHRGLWHAFRFNDRDNETASQFFQKAVDDDPGFSTAYSGLSFTHFQRAFLQYSGHTGAEIESALALAKRSLDIDPRNPQAHYAFGRATMIARNPDASIEALETAIRLEPNFAQAYYSLGLAQSQAGDPEEASGNLQHATLLSPIDPLQFAMISSLAICRIRLGRFDEAAQYAARGAARPHAHAQIFAIAALSCMLAGREDEARAHAKEVLKRNPDYSIESFTTAFSNFSARDRETLTAPLRSLGFE